MVSLFDMCLQRPLWAHLSTGIPTLDQMVEFQLDGVFDFQSVPANAGVTAMTCNLMVSHLRESKQLTLFVVETLNGFHWDLLRQHPQYDRNWENSDQIQIFSATSVVELFWFFAFGPAQHVGASTMLFITNFHEIVELYRLDIAAAHEEALLRHQIDKNRELLKNFDRIAEEGIELVSLPQLPPNSGLLKENPYIKAQNHVDELFKEMAEFTYKNSAIVVLLGHLDAVYKPYGKRQLVLPTPSSSFVGSQQNSLSQPVTREQNRLVLAPVTFSKPPSGKQALSDVGLNESRITARLIFYDDWYYKSPLFLSKGIEPREEDRYHVLVVKVTVPNGVSNINEPVYFEFNKTGDKDDQTWLVDLQVQDESNLSALIQNSLYSTLQMPRAASTQIARQLAIPSSPPVSTGKRNYSSFSRDLHSDMPMEEKNDQSSHEEEEIHNEFEELYIDGSDVELTGTLLEDLESQA